MDPQIRSPAATLVDCPFNAVESLLLVTDSDVNDREINRRDVLRLLPLEQFGSELLRHRWIASQRERIGECRSGSGTVLRCQRQAFAQHSLGGHVMFAEREQHSLNSVALFR